MLIFNTNKIDKPEAIKELRRALGAGAMGSALPSDEEILTLAINKFHPHIIVIPEDDANRHQNGADSG